MVAQSVAPRRSLVSNQAAIAQFGERQTEDLKVPSSILGLGICVARGNDDFVPTYSGSRLSCRVLSGIQNFSRHKYIFSRHKYIFFCFILILVFAKAQHSRPFSAHPPKLLILQSAIPLEQAVDRTFSDQQLGRPTGRRHNRKTTPFLPPLPHPPICMEPPHGGHCGRRSFFFTFASRGSNEKEGLLQMRFCDTWAQQFILLCNSCGVCEEDQPLRMCLDVTAQPLVDISEVTAVGSNPRHRDWRRRSGGFTLVCGMSDMLEAVSWGSFFIS